MRRSILAMVFCIAAWPCAAAVTEGPATQWIWPPFKNEQTSPPRTSLPLPPVLISAVQYGAGLTDALRERVFDSDQSGSEVTDIGAFRTTPSPSAAVKQHPAVPMRDVCDALVASAHRHHLPVPFFIRLIWQESGFNAHAVSPVGAQGMAQFMPATATQMGLDDPFDPIRALQASARLLRGLITQFGNVGLAAAAYNAGPKRIADWLEKRVKLPEETRHYVLNITGHAPDSWRKTEPGTLGLKVPKRAPCQPDGDFATMVEVPVPLQPKPHAHRRMLAQHPVKERVPVAAGRREQIIIDVAHNHVGPKSRPTITVLAAEPSPRPHASSRTRSAKIQSKVHNKVRTAAKPQRRVQFAMGPNSSRH